MSYRLSAGALAVLLAACTQRRETPLPADTPRVEIAPASADIWANDVRVAVRPVLGANVAACELVGNSRVIPLQKIERGFGAPVPLEPGNNRYFARCRARGGGVIESEAVVYTRTLADAPRAHIVVSTSEGKLVLDGRGSTTAVLSRAPLTRFAWTVAPGASARASSVGSGALLETSPPTADGDYAYALTLHDARGRSDVARVLVRVRGGRFELEPKEPSWLSNTVVYGLIPQLFGGERPLRAVRAVLPSLAELGITAIWISPVFATMPGDFGYAVTDYFKVRPDFGTEDDLEALVAEAHRRKLRVLLDFIPNHTASDHPYFRQADEMGPRSHYYGFYERDARGNPMHYFDWEHLPNLELSNPEVSRWITLGALFWLENAGVDGYRVDAAWGIREREPMFYTGFLRELRRIRPEALIIAEASAQDSFYLQNGFDAAYDWTAKLGKWAWEGVFETPAGIADRLAKALAETEKHASRADRVFRFLNNNDTGERFITRYGVGLTRVATALLLTLPGIPCIYAFDEQGGEYEPYAELPPRSLSHPELREFHRRLIALRRSQPALHAAGMRVLSVEPSNEVFAYLRYSTSEPAAPVVVALNFANAPASTSIQLPGGVTLPARWRRLEPSAERVPSAGLRVELPAYGYAVFVPE